MSTDFEDFLADQLPKIDSVLAERGVGLIHRPFLAAALIVESCIIEIKGDTKDDYFNKPWFNPIFSSLMKWYKSRYGKALQHSSEKNVSSAITIFGTPFRVQIPLVIKEPPLPDNSFWICFPIVVGSQEKPMNWVVNGPDFDSSTADEKRSSLKSLREVGTHLRAIYVNLMTAEYKQKKSHSLAQGILQHLEKGALDIADSAPGKRSIAIWGLNFACEKAIKTYLIELRIEPPRIHDIPSLHALANANSAQVNLKGVITKIPSERIVLKHRYNELAPPTLNEAMSIYQASLKIIDIYTSKLNRKFTFKNARFHLKMPPWFEGK